MISLVIFTALLGLNWWLYLDAKLPISIFAMGWCAANLLNSVFSLLG